MGIGTHETDPYVHRNDSLWGNAVVTSIVEGDALDLLTTEARPLQRALSWVRSREQLLVPSAALVLFLLAWQLAASTGLINQLFFASPSSIVSSGYHDVRTAVFWSNLRISVTEFAVGFGIGLLSGLLAGFALGWFWRLRFIFRPWVDALNSIPGIALVPLVLIWFGLGFSSKIALIVLIVFPVVVVNMYTATASISSQYLRVGQAFGSPRLHTLRTIVFPSIAPFAFAAARIGVGRAVSGVVVGEYFAGNAGLAYQLLQFGNSRDTPMVLFTAIVITVLALGAFRAVNTVERRVLRWQRMHTAFANE